MSKNRVIAQEKAEEVVVEETPTPKGKSAEWARRKRIVNAYKAGNPEKAGKELLSKDGKTLITLDEWVNEA